MLTPGTREEEGGGGEEGEESENNKGACPAVGSMCNTTLW